MSSITMLTENEKDQIRSNLEEYSSITEEVDLIPYLTEMDISDGEVEFRFFATPEKGPVEGIYFEVRVYDSTSWKVDSIGSYSTENMVNGKTEYSSREYGELDKELGSVIQDVLGEKPEFIMDKGSGVFTAEISVEP